MQNKVKKTIKFILPIFLLLTILLASRLFMFNADEKAKAETVTSESLVVISNEEALNLGATEKADTKYTVKFNANGGGANPPSQVIEEGGLAKRPADPVKAGYKFRGWFNGTTKWTFVKDEVKSDMTLIARYLKDDTPTPTPVEYTVSFDTNGGGTNPPNQVLEEGSLVTKPNDPSKTGYIFKGWYNSANSQLWDFASNKVSSDIKLIANYESVSSNCVIRFNANGGGANPPNQTVPVGSLVKRPPVPSKAGYTFRGWFNGTTRWVFASDIVTESMTLIARYVKEDTPSPTNYTVSFNTNGGGTNPPTQVISNGGLVTKPNNPYKASFIFKGWYNSETSSFWDFNKNTVSGNMTLFAMYDLDVEKYTVKFNTDGGTPTTADKLLEKGSLVPEPTQPYKAGYTFHGWYDTRQAGAVDEWDFAKDRVDADITLKALYEKVMSDEDYYVGGNPRYGTFKVTFHYVGGTPSPANVHVIKVPYGARLIEPPVPSRPDSVFLRWQTMVLNNGNDYWYDSWDFNLSVTSDMHLFAIFR